MKKRLEITVRMIPEYRDGYAVPFDWEYTTAEIEEELCDRIIQAQHSASETWKEYR